MCSSPKPRNTGPQHWIISRALRRNCKHCKHQIPAQAAAVFLSSPISSSVSLLSSLSSWHTHSQHINSIAVVYINLAFSSAPWIIAHVILAALHTEIAHYIGERQHRVCVGFQPALAFEHENKNWKDFHLSKYRSSVILSSLRLKRKTSHLRDEIPGSKS